MISKLPDPDPFWIKRWEAIEANISQSQLKMQGVKPYSDMLAALLAFGRQQFFYFFFGFSHENEFQEMREEFGYENGRSVQKLAKCNDFPPEFVLRSVIDQVIYDYEIMMRSYYQYHHGSDNERRTLKLVNSWGRELISQFSYRKTADNEPAEGTNKLLNCTPHVISYFNRSSNIRLIPYYNVALVGIPTTATVPRARRDLLVVPHELGHYLYWHGRLDGRAIREVIADLIQDQLPFVKNWIEEIFSDVFAVEATEDVKAIVDWALSLIIDNPPSAYWHDNDIHPIDAIRMTLYRIIAQLPPEINTIYEQKRGQITSRTGGEQEFKTKDGEGNWICMSRSELQSILKSVTESIRETIFSADHHRFDQVASAEEVVNSSIDTETWYQEFETLIDQHDPERDDAYKPANAHRVDDPPVRNFVKIRDTHYGDQALDFSIWKTVFAAEGWTFKGPDGRPTGDVEGGASRQGSFHL